jgi:hypothetical protein
MNHKASFNAMSIRSIWTKETLLMGLNESDLSTPIKEAIILWYDHPEIEERINVDITLESSIKKENRLIDKKFSQQLSPILESSDGNTMLDDFECIEVGLYEIKDGRPRLLTAFGVYLFWVLHGYLGSFNKVKTYGRMQDSSFLNDLLRRLGMSGVPSVQCLNDYMNLLSMDTIEYIFYSHIEYVEKHGLTSLMHLLGDSTFLEANSEFPTDSNLIYRLVQKAYKQSQILQDQLNGNMKNYQTKRMVEWIGELDCLDFEIIMTMGRKGGKEVRSGIYRKLTKRLEQIIKYLKLNQVHLKEGLDASHYPPVFNRRLMTRYDMIDEYITFAEITSDNCQKRVLDGKKVDAKDKVYSISDPDAFMVCKGQRVPIIGYRPTYTFTRNGFYCDLHIKSGNPSDSAVFQVISTRLKDRFPSLEIFNVDDGYASVKNYKYATDTLKIKDVSMSGAKGKSCTPEELYNSDKYRQFRKDRSAVESYIGVGKSYFGMDRLSSRGLPRVRRELMAKMTAANFCKATQIRELPPEKRISA